MSNGREIEKPCIYQIKVKGNLNSEWSGWFENLAITQLADDETLLTGQIKDQAALYGLLSKLGSIGIPLLSITRKELRINRKEKGHARPSYQQATNQHKQGENRMNSVEQHAPKLDLSKFENTSVLLWLGQSLRKIRGKPLMQEEVLDKVVNELKADQNLLGILLFGSVASGTHTWKSDIDLIFIYQTHEPDSGLVNKFVDGIAVQYFFTTLDTLIQNQDLVPYLLYMFCDAKNLYDRYGTVAPVLDQLKQYFASHPDVAADWVRFKELHQVEKEGPACAQTTIIQRWDELEEKYSGGNLKRTFFRM